MLSVGYWILLFFRLAASPSSHVYPDCVLSDVLVSPDRNLGYLPMNILFRQPHRYPAYAPINTLSICSGTRSATISGLPVDIDKFQWIIPTTKPNAHVVNDITKRPAHNFRNTTGIFFSIGSVQLQYTLYQPFEVLGMW